MAALGTRIGIVGGGAFGTAMACVARRSGHAVALWAREPEVVAAINRERRNPQFLPEVELLAPLSGSLTPRLLTFRLRLAPQQTESA